MGWDHSLSCMDCKEELINVGRNRKLLRDEEALNRLDAFMYKHADHQLIYDADDNWKRVSGARMIGPISEYAQNIIDIIGELAL